MKLAVPLLVVGVGCGSSSKPVEKPVEEAPPKKVVTRVPIEDDSEVPADGSNPDENVTFTKTKGSISQETILAGLEPHNTALQDCYMSKVGRRKWLGGHIVLQWYLEADGKISSVKMTESTLGAWPVEQCLLDIAWSAEFGKPSGGKVDFTVPLDFSAKGNTAFWDEDKALRAIGGQLTALDDCDDFEITPKVKPRARKAPKKKAPPPPAPADDKPSRPEKPPKNVVATMYVGPGGKLQSIGFSSATTEVGMKWSACAEKAAQSWRLPDPRGQIAKLAIRYRPQD